MDTGLHYYSNFTREDALWYFDKYAWDNTDLAKKEVHARTCIVCFYLNFFIITGVNAAFLDLLISVDEVTLL